MKKPHGRSIWHCLTRTLAPAATVMALLLMVLAVPSAPPPPPRLRFASRTTRWQQRHMTTGSRCHRCRCQQCRWHQHGEYSQPFLIDQRG